MIMSKKESPIHEFDLTPYDLKLWVVKGGSPQSLSDKFCFKDGKSTNEYFDVEYSSGITSDIVMDKESMDYGVVVWLRNGSKPYTYSHEACHVALMVFDYVGASVSADNQEPYAYFQAYIYKCIELVMKNKKQFDK